MAYFRNFFANFNDFFEILLFSKIFGWILAFAFCELRVENHLQNFVFRNFSFSRGERSFNRDALKLRKCSSEVFCRSFSALY